MSHIDELTDDIDALEAFRDTAIELVKKIVAAKFTTDAAVEGAKAATDALQDAVIQDELEAAIRVLTNLRADRLAQEPAEFPDAHVSPRGG